MVFVMTLFTAIQFLWGEGSFVLLLFVNIVSCRVFFFAYRRKLWRKLRVLHWKNIPSLKRQYYLNMNIKMCPKWYTWCGHYYPMALVCVWIYKVHEDIEYPICHLTIEKGAQECPLCTMVRTSQQTTTLLYSLCSISSPKSELRGGPWGPSVWFGMGFMSCR